MEEHTYKSRRQVLKASGFLLAFLGMGRVAFPAEEKKENAREISPPEDLMREHGILRRIVLIYRYFLVSLSGTGNIPWNRINDSAEIIRSFIENYHERLEERHVFPAMRKSGKLVDLVDVLLAQHQEGRKLTATIIAIAKRKGGQTGDHELIKRTITAFVRMYEPHASREDTVLFPQLHEVWRGREFDRMGDIFEKEEDRLFGEKGFEKMVDRVAIIEKDLGIYDLREFTPSL